MSLGKGEKRLGKHVGFVRAILFLTFFLSLAVEATCVLKMIAESTDHIHGSGAFVAFAAPFSSSYREGYCYYFTDPEYFDSLDWKSSPQQEDRSRANDDGTLGEFRPHYYVAHSDSGYGQKIASVENGAKITIDGISYIIDGRGLTYAGSPTRSVREMTGDADLILVSCVEGDYPDERHPEHVVWGHAAD